MFSSSKEYLNLSDREKIEKTDTFFEHFLNKKDRILSETAELIGNIDNILISNNKDRFDRLFEIVDDNKYVECIALSYELTSFKLWKQISIFEKEQGEQLTLERRYSYKECCEVYQRILFYLHRIEFDLPIDMQMELFKYMIDNYVSPICLFFIFNTDQITDKRKTALQISKLYSHIGNEKWALFFEKWIETTYDTWRQ